MSRIAKHGLWLLLFWWVLAGQVWAMPCDVDNDGDIDLDDLTLIQKAILARAKVSAPGDPRDPDNNALINSIDGRLCALRCTRARCGTINSPPFANAGADQSVRVGDLVQLSGAASSDPDGDPLRYTWIFSNRPLGSIASLLEAATVAPRFTADKPGQYLIQLVVSDGRASSAPDTVTVSTENSRPIANAGPDQSVRVGTLVMLNGGRSTDVDGDPLTYTWRLSNVPPDSAAALSNPDSVNPSLLIDRPGSYLIALTVSDGRLSSLPDTVAVTTENSPPVAHAGANQSIPLGAVITLDGSRSSDVDGNPLTFRWSLLARPANSQAVLSNPSSVQPSFTADFPGTYVAQLIVNDGSVDSAPASVTLTTANAAPIANAGADQTVPLGSQVTLDGSASHDPESAVLSHTWSLIGRPVGSNAALSASNTANPSFTADLPGNYIAQLIVHDGQLASPPDTVTISTTNSRPVADAGPPQTVTAGTPVSLDGSASHDADGDPLTFVWSLTTLPSGSSAVITGADLVTPSFVPDVAGTYIAQLIVSDGQLTSLPVTVVITVSAANRKPIAVAEAIPTTTPVGSSVTLKGSGSSDPDGDPLTWAWSIALRPAGSNAAIADPVAALTSFVPDVPGDYTIQLIVRDGRIDSVPALIVVQAHAVNHPPLIISTAVTTATVGQPYSYAVVASDPDVGDVLTYSLTAAPAEMTIDPASGSITWIPEAGQVGSQAVAVRVTDRGGLFAEQRFSIIVSLPNVPPVITSAGIAPQWTKLSPTGTPPVPRYAGSLHSYDEVSDRLIVFGGQQASNTQLNDVWVLIHASGLAGTSAWTKLEPTGTAPSPRSHFASAYDATANRLIVYGGCSGICSPLSDAWVLTHANALGGQAEWLPLPASNALAFPVAGYDPISNRLVVFGGSTGVRGSDTTDVKVLVDANGIGDPRWVTLSPEGARPPVRGHSQPGVYDPLSNTLIVFGGHPTTGTIHNYNDVWILSNANGLGGVPTWTQLNPAGLAPVARAHHTMAYDPNSNRLIVFGGTDGVLNIRLNDTWVLTHANGQGGPSEWIKLTSGATPAVASTPTAGYAKSSNRLIAALGISTVETVLNDVWVLASASGNCTAGQPCTFKVTASDPDVGDVLRFSLDAAPPGMVIDSATGDVAWTPSPAEVGNHAVTARATDRGGLFATQTFTATVAPVAVPNVVGLAPEWAESFIGSADLTVGTKTSQGGAITLNFDSLPSRQGWRYSGLVSDLGSLVSNPIPESQVFSLVGGGLVQNSMGVGFQTAVGHRYDFLSVADVRLPFSVNTRVRVFEEEGNPATNSYGFGFGAYLGTAVGTEILQVGIGVSRIADRFDQALATAVDNTQFHDYAFKAVPGQGSLLLRDGTVLGTSRTRVDSPWINFIFLGDTTAGTNARAEVTAYSFTQPRVVGQNPPAGTLVPNKIAVDLTIVDGPATETVPNVIGLSRSVAEAAIVTANLSMGAVTSAPHPTIPAGQVSDQSPLPNIHVPKDTPVAIVMSTGPPGPVNVAPIINSTPVLTATAGQPYAYVVTATDPNVGDVLTYSLITTPAAMSIAPITGLITWMPTLAQVGSHSVTVRVTDFGGLFVEQSFTIAVSASAPTNQPPSITSTAPLTATTGAPYSYAVTASDPDAGDTLTFSLPVAPQGMTIEAASGLIQWTPTAAQVGNPAVTVRVTDRGGLFAEQGFTVSVARDNHAPVAVDDAYAIQQGETLVIAGLAPAAPPVVVQNAPKQALVAQAARSYGRVPLAFEANAGQTDPRVRFLSRGQGYTLFLTPDEAVLALSPKERRLSKTEAVPNESSEAAHPHVLRLKLIGANAAPQAAGRDQLPGRSHYFTGDDPAHWRTGVPAYAKVSFDKVYPGIDLVYYGNQRQLEYDFVVAPGADPGQIRLAIQGADGVAIDAAGNLVLGTPLGEIRQHKPVVYQEIDGERRVLDGRYVLLSPPTVGWASPAAELASDTTVGDVHGESDSPAVRPLEVAYVGFEVAAYDHQEPLVIDPVLAYSTYLGGSSDDALDHGNRIAVDGDGNAYVTGSTVSADFPVKNAVQANLAGNYDVFVAKLNPAGDRLEFATFLGGSVNDDGFAIAVDGSRNVFIAGRINGSSNFPVTPGALQGGYSGGLRDGFFAKLNPSGDQLLYSTYLGGSGDDSANAMTVSAEGKAYITGFTTSANFPTLNALQVNPGGNYDAFVAVFNPAGGLISSTYFGGRGVDDGTAIALDHAGEVYLVGDTESDNLPTLQAVQPAYGGGRDAYVTKFDSAITALRYSTYLGGSALEQPFGVAVDSAGSAYVTGVTQSTNYPTLQPLQSALRGGEDAFVTKLTPSGDALVYSTYLGGRAGDEAWGIALDHRDNAYVVGETSSDDFPTARSLQAFGGEKDAFLAKLNASGNTLVFSTYLGGTRSEIGRHVVLDRCRDAYLAGTTASPDFPTLSAFQSIYGGGTNDAFVTKVLFEDVTDLALAKADTPDPVIAGNALRYTLTVRNLCNKAATGVTLTDTLPPQVTLVSATPTQGSCAEAASTITCNLGGLPGLASGLASAEVTIVATVNARQTGAITNEARVSADQDDPYPRNNSATATTNVAAAGGVLANDYDPDGDPITAILVGAPAHGAVTLNPNGTFTYIPAANFSGADTFTYKANDGALHSNLATVTITVQAVNHPPSITSAPVLSVAAGQPYTYDANATDRDAGDTLTFSLPTAPSGMTINATTGLINWTPTPSQVGTHPVTVRVTDSGGLFADQPFSITVNAPSPTNRAPTITSAAPLIATAGTPYSYAVTASDPDAGDTLTFSLSTAPAGMTINAATGMVAWTPTLAQVGSHNVTARVTDSGGLTAEQSFTVAVAPPPPVNLAPSFTSTPVTTAIAGQAYAYPMTATDPNAADVLSFSLPTGPAGMTINTATGLITWTPTLAQVGNHSVTVRVTDSGGLLAEQGFTISVTAPGPVNQPPSLTSTPVTTATAGTPYTYAVTATDPDAGDTLSYSLTTAPAGMSIDAASGLIQWTPSAGQIGDHPVEVKVQDAGGLFATQPFMLTVSAVAVCVPPPAGLVSWWPGEGTPVDRAAANDGLAENGPIYAAGLVGQAFRFDGVDDLIRIANGRTIGFSGPFSVEFWFNPANTIDSSDAQHHVLLAKGQYLIGNANAPQAIRTLAGDGRLLVSLPDPLLVSTTDTWPAGTWQHLALTWDGARYRLYVNGVEENSVDNPVSILDNPAALTLGWDGAFANSAYAGLLDEATLYSRALSPAEIAALHAARSLGKCTAPYSRADAGPDQAVEIGNTVTLDGSASRAFDGVPLTYQWTLTTRPADSTALLTNPTTVSPGFVADKAGPYTLDLIVSNAGHPSAPDSVRITATQVNHPPTITSTAITAATVGAAYTYPVTASDPDAGDTLSFSLPAAPAGMSINAASGLIQWTPNAGQIGSHPVTVRVQDAVGLFATQSYLLVVVAAPVPVSVPNVVGQEQAAAQAAITAASLSVGTITLAASDTVAAGRVISQNPAAGSVVNSGSAVNLVVSSGPQGPAVTAIRVTPPEPLLLTGQTQAFAATGILANGSSLPLGSAVVWQSSNPAVASIDANGVATALAAGSTTIRATQDSASGETLFTVAQAVADGTLPIAAITSPVDGASVASAVPIVGTASDANFLKYLIEIAPFETGVFSTLHVGTAPVTNGTLATLDPTTLLNDLYVLRLTVIDRGDNRTQTEITVQITRDKKVGNFTLAFQDLNVPMAGIPISVVRSYDSRDKTQGDFGIGWRLDVQSLRLRVTGIPGQGWQQTQSGGVLNRRYTISPTRVHKVAITLPDGKVEEFDMAVSPSTQQFAPIQVVDAVYTPRAQTRGSLRAVGETRLVTFGATGPIDLLTESGLEIYSPAEYEYTTPDGQVILISRSAGVKQIRDRSGNTVTFAPGGITHSAGKSIVFNRDGQGRITTVTDPMGNVQSYAYDINGDLASHTDAEGRRTSFLYNYDHGLIEIQDPRGIRPIRNDYDEAGRLIKTTDAYGKEITYTHDLGANRELITDRLGNTTIHVYDDLGNVTQTADPLGGVTNRSYDGRGNTLSETDPLGRTRSYTYDGQDNRLTETDPLGQTTTYTYNNSRQVLTVTDALGRTTTNAYDANGSLVGTTDPAGKLTTYTYDSRGLQLTRTDPLGQITSYAYDASGNLASETDALNRVTTYTYDANGNRLTQTSTRTTAGGPETLSTRFAYDRANRLTETTHPDGSLSRVAYNAIGKQSITTDPLGRETRYEYDDMGRLSRTTYPDGSSETSTWDAEGRRTGSTDRAGRTTSSTYDALGRLIETIAPDGSRTTTTYDATGQVRASTDARGNVTSYEYDAAGRRSKVTDAAGAATLFTYDALGNQIQVTDANGHTVSFQYDANNRRTRTTYADATFDQVTYDALGRQTAKTDQAAKTTQFTYDALGRLIRVTDALGQITSYSYDEQGNQLTQTDAEGRTTSFAYDRMGRRIKRTLPLGQTETFTYDAAGNLRTKTDFNGMTTSYTYDTVNRLLRKTPDASLGQPSVIFTYTPSGQRASMQDASGSTTYSYDSRDRLLSKATPQGTLNYSYDPAGNLTRIQSNHVGGAAMNYTYDPRNRLASVTDASGTTTYSYDAVGNLAGFLYPNGVQTSYTYNPLNRLNNVTGAKGATLASYTYTLGPSGNRTAVTEASGRRVDYTYDDLYRLRSETISADPAGPNGAIVYTYDQVGNRLTRVSTVAGIPDQSFEYDFNDRLGGEGYDNNGNTLTSGGRTYGYDFENHLTSADGGVSFVYNGDGIRVAKTAGGVTTGFLVDDRNPTGYAQVLEEVVGGAVERSYTYGLKLISQKQASGVSFYGYDGHGSVRYLTDAGGNVTDIYAYEAFGNLVAQAGATPNVYLYAGEQLDQDLRSYYLRSRYFSSRTGRLGARDRFEGYHFDPASLHSYTYANNDPSNKVDPSGHTTLTELQATVVISGLIQFNTSLLISNARSVRALLRGQFPQTPGEVLGDALIDGLIGSISGAAGLYVGYLARGLKASGYVAGAASGFTGQVIKEFAKWTANEKEFVFMDAAGRVGVATFAGLGFGGVFAKIEASNLVSVPTGTAFLVTRVWPYPVAVPIAFNRFVGGSIGGTLAIGLGEILAEAYSSWTIDL